MGGLRRRAKPGSSSTDASGKQNTDQDPAHSTSKATTAAAAASPTDMPRPASSKAGTRAARLVVTRAMFAMLIGGMSILLLMLFTTGAHTLRLGRASLDLGSMDPRCLGHRDPALCRATAAARASKSLQQRQHSSKLSSSTTSSSSSRSYKAHAAEIRTKAATLLPRKSSADRGGYIEFLLFVSDASQLPSFNDKQFNPVVVPVLPPVNSANQRRQQQQQQQQQQEQQQQLGPAGDMMALLAQHKAQFLVSVGDKGHFGFLQQLPAQFRSQWFHLDSPGQLTAPAVESFYFAAVRSPPEGSPAEPLLSLFTPAYKSGAKIQIPFKSLLAQTYQNWEWVIYDDSPPEHTETWAALSALRDRDPRIVPLRTDRNDAFIGSVKAQACAAARGALLVELDHDDELTPDALEVLKDAFVANPDAGLLYGETVRQYEGTNDTVDYGSVWGYGYGAHYKMLVDGVWMTGGIAPAFNQKTLRHIVGVPNHVRAWSRKAYLELGGHLPGLAVADDYELILRSLFKYPSVYVRHMGYIQYRQLDGSTFTFTRNALIQRLVAISSKFSEGDIHELLEQHGLQDRGPSVLEGLHSGLQDEWAPMGRPIERYYHKPTATAPRDRPWVTVVVPTYNNTQGLMAALQSVYSQDYPNWELLVVGDKCPLLDDFMEQHKQLFAGGGHFVRYYNLHHHRGHGHHSPLNMAVRGLVASDWVAYIKDNAVWKPDHLSSLVSQVVQDPSRAYAFSSIQFNDKVLISDFPRKYRLDTSGVLHHRRLIEQYGGWRSTASVGPANDWELFSRWAGEPWGATLSPSVIYTHLEPSLVDWLIQQV